MQPNLREDFEALRNPKYDNFVLVDCQVNGEESAAICVVRRIDEETADLFPVFVAVTPGMKLVGPEGRMAEFGPVGEWEATQETKMKPGVPPGGD